MRRLLRGRAAGGLAIRQLALSALLVLASPHASIAAAPRSRAAAPAARPALDLHDDVRSRSEALWDSGRSKECFAFLDSVELAGRSHEDTTLVLAARLWRARQYVNEKRNAESLALLDTLERQVRGLHDAGALAWIYDNRAIIIGQSTDPEVMIAGWRRSAQYARAAKLPLLEGRAHQRIGDAHNYAGRFEEALREFGLAKPLLPLSATSRVLLPLWTGQALASLGRNDAARREYHEGLELCRTQNRPGYERYYLNNLGSLESEENDPGAALTYFEQALALPRVAGDSARTMGFELNRAWTICAIGPPERGLEELRKLETPCERLGNVTLLTFLHSWLSRMYLDAGENEAALAHARRSLQFVASADAQGRITGAWSLARCLEQSGRLEEALATVDSVVHHHPEEVRAFDLLSCQNLRAELLIRLGRLPEAEAVARDAERRARPGGPLKGSEWMDAGTMLARVHRERGRPDSALAQIRQVRMDWERRQATITREELREGRGASAAAMFGELGLDLLDSRRRVGEATRNRQAFDALQQFQARTLEERMRGAGLSARAFAHRISIDSLQRSVLRPDELLLDIVATPDTTFAFAVTRSELRVRALPGLLVLEPRVQRLMPAMESAHEGAGPDAALAWMSARVLAPFADLLRSHPRLVVTGGGPLALLPWAALPGPDGQPLLTGHEVVVAPSATLWAGERVARAPAVPTHLLVLGRTTDTHGRTLDGVREECRAVQRYAGITSRVHPGDRPLAKLVADLDRFDAIHLAAHMYADNTNPWRSGVLMGSGQGDDAYLRASDIARRKLSARLVVLSGCQSAAARSLPGEGPQGIASAFLCAGTPTVVATLWNVRDDVAADFATRFYAALAGGAGAARAQRDAQKAMRAAGHGPGDWGAFVVWGSGDTRLPLKRATGMKLMMMPGTLH